MTSTETSPSKHDVFGKANLDYFDKIAKEYDELPHGGSGDGAKDSKMVDMVREISQANYEAMLQAVEWNPAQTEMMDFACGTGMTTLLLAPHCKRVVGVDQSEAMLNQFRGKLSKLDIGKSAASESTAEDSLASKVDIILANLLGSGEQSPGNKDLHGRTFDIIICTMSFHHFAEPEHAAKVLAQYLNPGGKLVIVDFLDVKGQVTSTENSHGHGHLHHHHHAHSHGHDHGHGHGHKHGDASKDNDGHEVKHDLTEATFNNHRVQNVIAHTSFVLSDFDRFFAAAGLQRAGEPRFSTVMKWPGRAAQDLYVVVGQKGAASATSTAAATTAVAATL